MRSNPFWPRHSFVFFKSGGGGQQPAPQTIVSSTPPPPTSTNVEVQQAQRDQRKQAAKRKGVQATILAGEGSGQMGVNPMAPKTILGS
jgi:hypothetical protein